MEIKHKRLESTVGGRFLKLFLIIFLLVFGLNSTPAQESDSLKDSTTTSAASDDSGPSLHNLSKALDVGGEQLTKFKEEERRKEILSYVYMGLGFSLVIAIAWFATSIARKRQRKEDEKKALRLANMKHKPHHHRR